jgi:hypothetical protein
MSEVRLIERGRMSRVAYARIGPNEDLMQGVESSAWRRDSPTPSCAARSAA